MSQWTLSDLKQQVGRQCGDPNATSYSDAIKDHIIDAIEGLAEDIVAIADIDRALTDDERKRYNEVINLSEVEIYPMLTEIKVNPSYTNSMAIIAISNVAFPRVNKIRNVNVNPQLQTNYNFRKANSLSEIMKMKRNPHCRPGNNEAAWFIDGNKVYIYWGSNYSIQLIFYCFTSIDYSRWTDTTDLQSLGFGSNFLTMVTKRAAYTMRLQLNLEKE